MTPPQGPLPLEGVRVLDASHIIAGPFCVSILADYGAEVIKVEPPGAGELGRRLGAPVKNAQGQAGFSPSFAVTSRSCKGVALNLRTDAGMVQTPKEIYDCPQLQARDLFIDVDDGIGGTMRTTRMPVKSSAFAPSKPTPPPHVGEHTREVVASVLGYSDAQWDAFAAAGAFGRQQR